METLPNPQQIVNCALPFQTLNTLTVKIGKVQVFFFRRAKFKQAGGSPSDPPTKLYVRGAKLGAWNFEEDAGRNA
jgi:hypothetical protein